MSERVQNRLSQPVVLVHIPRCAGTSVAQAIRSACGISDAGRIDPIRVRKAAETILRTEEPDEFFTVYPLLQQYLLSYLLREGQLFLCGHLPVSPSILEEFAPTQCFVTILRDPVERWISHYIFNKLVNADPLVPPTNNCLSDPQEELDCILNSQRGWQLGHLITTFLAGKAVPRNDSGDAVDIANKNLCRFKLVGFVEELDDFSRKFHDLFGVRLTVPELNSAADLSGGATLLDELRSMFTDRVRRDIAKLCEDDYRVYERARSLFR